MYERVKNWGSRDRGDEKMEWNFKKSLGCDFEEERGKLGLCVGAHQAPSRPVLMSGWHNLWGGERERSESGRRKPGGTGIKLRDGSGKLEGS